MGDFPFRVTAVFATTLAVRPVYPRQLPTCCVAQADSLGPKAVTSPQALNKNQRVEIWVVLPGGSELSHLSTKGIARSPQSVAFVIG